MLISSVKVELLNWKNMITQVKTLLPLTKHAKSTFDQGWGVVVIPAPIPIPTLE